MFSIKFLDPVIFSPFFPQRASLKNYEKNMENFPGSPKYDFKHWAYVRPIFKTKYHLSSWESLIPDYFDPIIKYNAVPQITWFYYTKENSNIAPFFPFFLFSDIKSDIRIGNVRPSWNQALPKDQFWYQIWYQQKTFTYIRTLNIFLSS